MMAEEAGGSIAPGRAGTAGLPPRQPSVLVVDDEPAMRSLCAHLLSEEGWEADQAPGADAALERMKDHAYDIVLTDLCMEGMDGSDLARRARVRYPKTSVILMTGFPTVESAVQALHDGASDYILKPFSKEALIEAVQRCWETRRLAEQLERVHSLKAELEAAREELAQIRAALPEEARRLASLLKKGGGEAGSPAEDLLTYADMEGGQLRCRMRDMDLGALLRDLIAQHRSLWEERGLAVALDFDPKQTQAWADPELMRAALKQLLAGAARHGAPGDRLELSLRREAERFVVELTGIGRGFDEPAGMGLALTIARRALRLQGGAVEVQPAGKGRTRCLVTLPRPSVTG